MGLDLTVFAVFAEMRVTDRLVLQLSVLLEEYFVLLLQVGVELPQLLDLGVVLLEERHELVAVRADGRHLQVHVEIGVAGLVRPRRLQRRLQQPLFDLLDLFLQP